MDSDADRIVTNLNLEEVLDKYITWNHLPEDKFISSLIFLNANPFVC